MLALDNTHNTTSITKVEEIPDSKMFGVRPKEILVSKSSSWTAHLNSRELLKANSAGHALFWLVAFFALLAVSCNERTTREALPTGTEGGEMVTLSIDFQDGFEDDTVVLRVNGEEAFRKDHVSTKQLLGLAVTFNLEVERGPVSVDINVPTRDIAKTILLEVSADTYLGLSIVNSRIEYRQRDKPFGYG